MVLCSRPGARAIKEMCFATPKAAAMGVKGKGIFSLESGRFNPLISLFYNLL